MHGNSSHSHLILCHHLCRGGGRGSDDYANCCHGWGPTNERMTAALGVKVLSLAIWLNYSDSSSSVDGRDTIAEEVVGLSHSWVHITFFLAKVKSVSYSIKWRISFQSRCIFLWCAWGPIYNTSICIWLGKNCFHITTSFQFVLLCMCSRDTKQIHLT